MFHYFIELIKKNSYNFSCPRDEIKIFFENITKTEILDQYVYCVEYKICLFFFIIISLYIIIWFSIIFLKLKIFYKKKKQPRDKKNFENCKNENFFLKIIIKYINYYLIVIYVSLVFIFDWLLEKADYYHNTGVYDSMKNCFAFFVFILLYKLFLILNRKMGKLRKFIEYTTLSLIFFLIFFKNVFFYFWLSIVLVIIIPLIVFFIAKNPYLKIIYFFEILISMVYNTKIKLYLFFFFNKLKLLFEKIFITEDE